MKQRNHCILKTGTLLGFTFQLNGQSYWGLAIYFLISDLPPHRRTEKTRADLEGDTVKDHDLKWVAVRCET